MKKLVLAVLVVFVIACMDNNKEGKKKVESPIITTQWSKEKAREWYNR